MRRHAPATARNRDPILAVLTRVAPLRGTVLEIACGSGEHAVYLAPRLRARTGGESLVWQPADPDPDARASTDEWVAHEGLDEIIRPAIELDAMSPDAWSVPSDSVASIVCINMIHIAPWDACLGLFRGAARVLEPGGVFYLYGPYKRGGVHTADSNAAFDESLRARDPSWGVRDLDDVVSVAKENGFALREVVEMPANNLSVVFGRETTR